MVWLYKHDPELKLPYQEQLAALIHDPTFKQTTGPALFAKARLIKDLGNLAAHSPKPLLEKDSLRATEDLFHFLFWLARTYSRIAAPLDAIAFDASILPTEAASPKSVAQIQKLESDLQARNETLYELIAGRQNIDAELQRLREEIAAVKAANNAKPDTHDYSEAETRDYFIDLLLSDALLHELDRHRNRPGRHEEPVIHRVVEVIRVGRDAALEIEDPNVSMFENVLKRLRSLVCLIEKKDRHVVYTDFEDEMGDEVEVELGPFASAGDFEKFRAKARQFLREHENHIAVHTVRSNRPLTSTDIAELERILVESGVGTPADVQRAAETNHGLGLFVRSLVGLDRGAAKEAFAAFLTGKALTANQIEFVNMIINHLTENGAMDPSLLYSSPYTDFSPRGVDGVFASPAAAEIVSILRSVSSTAAA